jgi:hypothetical protein
MHPRALFGLCALAACEAYPPLEAHDPSCGDGQVSGDESCDTAIDEGEPGACPAACGEDQPCEIHLLIGSRCQARCFSSPIERPRDGDGCCPPGENAAADADCQVCGDGIVSLGEYCDPPEECPTEKACKSDIDCVQLRFSGAAERCTARCELGTVSACIDGDECCPGSCDHRIDDDCSVGCGDGVVDAANGETCEPSVEETSCQASCDDGQACTHDERLGSDENCNVACSNVAITQPISGDACCPASGNAQNDSDCPPECGNAVIEGEEECDGGELCGDDCTRLFHPALLHRYPFNEQGDTARDFVGSADATLRNVVSSGEGSVVLAGGSSDQYIDLPNGLVSSLIDATFEAWLSWRNDSGADHERIMDFGTSSLGEDMQAGGSPGYLYLSPSGLGDGRPRLAYKADVETATLQINPSAQFPSSTIAHVAVVFRSGVEMSLYVDGSLAGSLAITGSLASLTDNNNWLGRSQFASDEELDATLHEFRIYDQALSAGEIAASHAAGPDPQGR